MAGLSVDERVLHLREAAEAVGLTASEVVLPADPELQVNGLAFHLLDWGGTSQTPVLFLHGGSLTAHTWDLVCLSLRDEYRCFALDLRGHGDSSWSPDGDYSLGAYAADVEGVVEALGLDRFILVGMSLGGAIALTYAGRHAVRLAGLVIVDTGPEGRPSGRARIANFVSHDRELPSIEDFVTRAMAFNPRRQPELLRRSLLHNLRETPTGAWTWKWDPRLRRPRDPGDADRRRAGLWDAVSLITCPTLVLRGGDSDVFHDEDAERLAAALPRGAWVRIDGAGHTVQGDRPVATASTLRTFFASIGDGA
ncbi:MAG: alpha/beta hydrolase [Chloroflexi bacterium]|nr:alpha/beta hydrolase [Chloroflexota bacterium]